MINLAELIKDTKKFKFTGLFLSRTIFPLKFFASSISPGPGAINTGYLFLYTSFIFVINSNNIYLIYQGNHRAIEIPEAWKKMRCGRAQIKLSWLTLLFLDDIEDGLHPNHHATRKKGVPGKIGKIQPNTAKTSDT